MLATKGYYFGTLANISNYVGKNDDYQCKYLDIECLVDRQIRFFQLT
jgi:hypothetical protein